MTDSDRTGLEARMDDTRPRPRGLRRYVSDFAIGLRSGWRSLTARLRDRQTDSLRAVEADEDTVPTHHFTDE